MGKKVPRRGRGGGLPGLVFKGLRGVPGDDGPGPWVGTEIPYPKTSGRNAWCAAAGKHRTINEQNRMAISNNSTYIPTINEFLAHWSQCNEAYAPKALVVRVPNNTTVNLTQFTALRDGLQAQQNLVQSRLNLQWIARGNIELRKTELLKQFHLFTGVLDSYYLNTDFYSARPLAPGLGFGQEAFSRPLVDAMTLWESMNEGPAPAGRTLPLVLADTTTQGAFASAIAALQFAYAVERRKAQDVTLARSGRNRIQDRAYEVMKVYRDAVPTELPQFPDLVETLPRLTPAPGHTPAPVNASAVFEAPNSSKVVYEASADAMLHSYQLRGTVGDEYSDEDAIVIASHEPGESREFVTPFGLNQPGAKVALKVYVILTTGNEAGSGAMFVERPANVQPLAA